MSRLTRDGTAEPVSRDQNLRRERGQGNVQHFPCSADHEQDWQPYPVDSSLAIWNGHAYLTLRAFATNIGVFSVRTSRDVPNQTRLDTCSIGRSDGVDARNNNAGFDEF